MPSNQASKNGLMKKTGDGYGNYNQTNQNNQTMYVTNQTTHAHQVAGLVKGLKKQGHKHIHIFTGSHAGKGSGNNVNSHNMYKYGFAEEDYALEGDGVTVTPLNFTQAPKMGNGVGIMTTCYSGYAGQICPNCGTYTVHQNQSKGHFLCQAPNCGWSGYNKSKKQERSYQKQSGNSYSGERCSQESSQESNSSQEQY